MRHPFSNSLFASFMSALSLTCLTLLSSASIFVFTPSHLKIRDLNRHPTFLLLRVPAPLLPFCLGAFLNCGVGAVFVSANPALALFGRILAGAAEYGLHLTAPL